MAGSSQLAETPRDSFLEAAQKELIAFERKEREFRKKQSRSEQQNCDCPYPSEFLLSKKLCSGGI